MVPLRRWTDDGRIWFIYVGITSPLLIEVAYRKISLRAWEETILLKGGGLRWSAGASQIRVPIGMVLDGKTELVLLVLLVYFV